MEAIAELFRGLIGDHADIFTRLGALDFIVIAVNILLMIFARRILELIYHDNVSANRNLNRVHVIRALNLLIILSFGYYHLYLPTGDRGIGLKLVSVFVVIYLGYLSAHIIGYIARRKFGKTREVNGVKKSVETYNSRLMTLLSGIFIFIIVLISVVQILGFSGLLEAGGVIGFIGVFLALTHNAWAPDIFSGLIILNSGMAEEGDVVEITEGTPYIGVVYKTKMFHTEILNMVNNHRIMLKNAKFRDYTIHNLSKFASAKGLREKMGFKIGYDVDAAKVREMFEEAYEEVKKSADIGIEKQYELEIRVNDTGDHAIEWSIYYYTKDVRNLIKIRQFFREIIWQTAERHSIALATPMTHSVVNQQT
ncbi:MAG: mechanosensitive ion channel family protein [Candidatus Thiodiazotropha lotti]|uniref:Small-conductance mechanosensitive channel n=1 Tax=Candidatus Thiodiazotropha lotti TaxID=2792787 RepID=A0A9E4K4A2_9GAMM|nr:mechanosensitive ion channel family protein [Candidatus Thiodiazotropha lotti]MCG7930694.1 mechanosensitive ion channel family protein [Candidatus Thiodiazotropha lotti]MCG7938977.1 mechanosensitive ion channel family protein [Candidatus Thiodiazotropha lotti]MCG8003592.1 mechanosensitive ion channel family protein [Candidatus Thiodiazotropha lotti]MCG8009772.1 mechanosensitive ion channel family protein [Candidatus Thiodiazotropha lotti]